MTDRIVLFGASGFVGSAVANALASTAEVVAVPAPRLTSTARTAGEIRAEGSRSPEHDRLVQLLTGVTTVVNAAGDPDASSLDENGLFGANALLPAVLLAAARDAGVGRFVQISSAVVQNDKPVLDSSEDLRPFSPYSASKVVGEEVVRESDRGAMQVVRYRPPSVHDHSRRVTRMIRRIATSPAATVARPGDQPTPQALLPNVASAVAFLATTPESVPEVVHHPSESVTVSRLMEDLSGGRSPVRIPRGAARLGVRGAKALGRLHRPTAANARRVEILWLGQDQAKSWLTEAGWTPPVGREGWHALAQEEAATP
ncbi:NAD-dependent epimerase/dehydratase family protein [Nocardioides gilvus]|uniref:NAD-dependent epimerase/dehydratase family protein n=1 Tax=Nocardioides gilvus TaxID=1735589 RepID=UPI0013A5B7E9|nr:NAD-dependent epimerase/dehydratase family protein [Nocardioides gilvus]